MKSSGPSLFSTHPPNSSTWCEHHLSATHNSANCNTYKKWVTELWKGGFKKPDKADVPDSANVVDENVSESLTQHIHAYLSSEQSNSGRNTFIIDSGATS